MIRRHRKQQHMEEPTVNLTPLIDVVFSILIMFIVVAPLLELDKVQLADANPESKDGTYSVQEAGSITIHVHQDNTIWLNQKLVEIDNLPALLKNEKRKSSTACPKVFHDKRAHFGVYQSIKNACEIAGFDNIDIILNPNA